jgi:5-methyltetrahydrofolate--homocysteine methyltransferase
MIIDRERRRTMSNVLEEIQKDLYSGKLDGVKKDVKKALQEGLSAQEVLAKGLLAGMDKVGKDFKAGDLFIPEVLMCAKAMHAGLDILKPLLVGLGTALLGKIVIGTVAGDLHDIGKNLVRMMLEGAGFEIIDLGVSVSPEKFVEAVRTNGAKLMGMSALLTTTMPSMKLTIEGLKKAGIRENVKVLVGGAPVTASFAESIGADAYAPDAASAVDVARELIM